tara:strand:+ start:7266 stop:7952 length:687 start_codon:yes stop_codon:yes gene_type:complete
MTEKKCRLCQLMKPLEGFPTRASAKDGRRTDCRDCVNNAKKMWSLENVEKIKKYNVDYQIRHPERVKAASHAAKKRHRQRNLEECRAAYRDWYANNKDKARAASTNWAIKHPNWFKNYAIENKEKIAVKNKNWAQNNKGLVREKTRRYQATKLKATPPWLTAIHHAQIQEMYDVAVALEMQTGVPHHVDHIHPLQGQELCGLHVPWNLQVLPWRDNIAKSNKLIGEMR